MTALLHPLPPDTGRLTLPELSRMMRELIRDRRYQQDTRLGAVVANYLAWKKLGASTRTFEIYEGYLARLCITLAADNPAAEQVTEDMLLTALSDYPAGSRELVRVAYRGFFKWAAKRGGFPDPAADLPHVKTPPMRVYNVFSAAEQARLIKAADELALPWVQRLRVLCLLELGVRKEEARLLQVEDFDPDPAAKAVVVKGKGGKERLVRMSDDLWRAFVAFRNRPLPNVRMCDDRGEYRESRKPLDGDYLFFACDVHTTGAVTWTNPAKPLSQRGMHHWWAEQVVPAAGVKYRSMHMARHTVGTDLASAEVDAFTMQDWLGHADPKTTKIYVHNSRARLAKGRTRLDEYRQGRG